MAFDLNMLLSAQLHDIKNEMQALLCIQDELADHLCNAPQCKPAIARMTEHSQLLNHRLVELLSVLKMQNQGFCTNEDEHWLMDTLSPIKDEFQRLYGFTVHNDFDPDFNGFYDEQLLEIALHNCFTNARQAGAQACTVTLQAQANGAWSIFINDDGPGFEEEQLTASGINPQGTQSGLGLYLIQQAMRAHKRGSQNGDMHISNQAHGGAQIQLMFP